ncbi:GPN-loop GTPase 1 isoform X2 [Hydra vulgaris]|uniref:GPN-loop GTPase n=1 Tax=Hydra vulgaris TaxID=6087 RepID=A0ABM4CD43_HYDVU
MACSVENEISEELKSIKIDEKHNMPCILVLGMAGSGKTTFVQRLTSYLYSKKTPPYVINLDPAVHEIPYPANIDIRDTVDYKEVMKQYNLGPNGAIMTSLNLFVTKFDQVLNFVENKNNEYSSIIIDTPGQIEVFTWSASGAIITESLASALPTIIVYVMDTARSTNPVTFMSNMLYACSIMYKTKLPFIVLLNKIDIVDHSFITDWMTNFDSFQDALSMETSYISNLTRSMSLVLDEFYEHLKCVGVSSVTGLGMDNFMSAISTAIIEYNTDYKPELEKKKVLKTKNEDDQKSLKSKSSLESGFFTKPVPPNIPINYATSTVEESDEENIDESEIREEHSFSHFLGSNIQSS